MNIKNNKVSIKKSFFLFSKKFLSIICPTAILSLILFYSLKISFLIYFAIVFFVFLFFTSNYHLWKNQKFYRSFCLAALFNLLIFLVQKYQIGFRPAKDCLDIHYISYAAILLLTILFSSIAAFHKQKKNKTDNPQPLFEERLHDLDRIKKYLTLPDIDVIGVNAKWGDGKTLLINNLEKTLENDFIFVKIGVLSATIDSIEQFILNELDHLLDKAFILSSASSKIKTLLSQPIMRGVGNFFFDKNSYTELFASLKDDLKRTGKIIIISYEDIDRINNPQIIYKIFSITDMLKCDVIKFIYQYDEHELLGILKKDRLYLEKYIPYKVNLTPINFQKLIKYSCDNNNYKSIKADDFYFLSWPIPVPNGNTLLLKKKKQINIEIPFFSIRKLKIFLDEIDYALKSDIYKTVKNHKNIVITFFFIKHFFYNMYDKIDIKKNISEMNFFFYNNEPCSIKKLLAIGNFSEDEFYRNHENEQNLGILDLLEFDLNLLFLIKDEKGFNKKRTNDFLNHLKANDHNEKCERLIKNLYANGLSEYSDFEYAVTLMEKVLDAPAKEKMKKYEDFRQAMYQEHLHKDNHTIFRIGISSDQELFLAFELYENNSEYWIKLIDFYLEKENVKKITSALIDVLCRCRISNRKVYLHTITIFNNLEIAGNLNTFPVYWKFLLKYINALATLGFINTHKSTLIEVDDVKIDIATEVLSELIQNLSSLKEKNPVEAMNVDVQTMIDFLDKNKELINCSYEYQCPKENANNPIEVNSPYYTKLVHDYKTGMLDEQNFKKELGKGYTNQSLRPYEVIEAWNNLQNKV